MTEGWGVYIQPTLIYTGQGHDLYPGQDRAWQWGISSCTQNGVQFKIYKLFSYQTFNLIFPDRG